MGPLLKICAVNFWDGFSLESGFVKYLLDLALDSFLVVPTQQEADIVLTTPFTPRRRRWYRPHPKGTVDYPEKAIAFIWENQRPVYQNYGYSLSSDFDSYGRRNCRLPYWYGQLKWPGMIPERRLRAPGDPHGFEPPAEIDSLLHPRSLAGSADRERFCCLVAANPEPHRMFSAQQLSRIERVDLYGRIAGKAHEGSKYDLLSNYRFNICFENSIFPGYYTEKLLQAWVGGCVPLYYADPWFAADFNPKAAINRANFRSLQEFADHVAEINSTRAAMVEIVNQPLLTKRPTLDAAVQFLRQACIEIANRSGTARSRADVA